MQSWLNHSALFVSTPVNPLPGVGAPAAPHTLSLLSPPASLSLTLTVHDPHSVDGCMTPLGPVSPLRDRRGAAPPGCRLSSCRQQIRQYLPFPPPVHQHLCQLLSLGLGDHSSWVSPSTQLLDRPGCCDPSPMNMRGMLAIDSYSMVSRDAVSGAWKLAGVLEEGSPALGKGRGAMSISGGLNGQESPTYPSAT